MIGGENNVRYQENQTCCRPIIGRGRRINISLQMESYFICLLSVFIEICDLFASRICLSRSGSLYGCTNTVATSKSGSMDAYDCGRLRNKELTQAIHIGPTQGSSDANVDILFKSRNGNRKLLQRLLNHESEEEVKGKPCSAVSKTYISF